MRVLQKSWPSAQVPWAPCGTLMPLWAYTKICSTPTEPSSRSQPCIVARTGGLAAIFQPKYLAPPFARLGQRSVLCTPRAPPHLPSRPPRQYRHIRSRHRPPRSPRRPRGAPSPVLRTPARPPCRTRRPPPRTRTALRGCSEAARVSKGPRCAGLRQEGWEGGREGACTRSHLVNARARVTRERCCQPAELGLGLVGLGGPAPRRAALGCVRHCGAPAVAAHRLRAHAQLYVRHNAASLISSSNNNLGITQTWISTTPAPATICAPRQTVARWAGGVVSQVHVSPFASQSAARLTTRGATIPKCVLPATRAARKAAD